MTEPPRQGAIPLFGSQDRSEEHTSELQSLRHLVCRLLLEKKKEKRIDRRSPEWQLYMAEQLLTRSAERRRVGTRQGVYDNCITTSYGILHSRRPADNCGRM